MGEFLHINFDLSEQLKEHWFLQSMGPLENVPERVAKFLGWNGEGGIHQAMKILQMASPERLIKAQNFLLGNEVNGKFISCQPILRFTKMFKCQ